MPFNTDVTNGTVIYSPGNFDQVKMVSEDWLNHGSDANATPPVIGSWGPRTSLTTHLTGDNGETFIILDPLEIAIGKYERMILKYHIHFDQNTTGQIKFRLHTPADIAQIHAVATGLKANGDAINELDVAVDPEFDLDEAGTTGYLEWEAVVQTGPTAGFVRLQFGQVADNAGPAVIRQGSHVEYMRF